ncbi:aldehyde dehydrogenase family protein, partial [Paraburkholderia sp. Se-20369]|nr:aldehyde dehydrogenase family protein [Paraburkholderia sp. Se-20369]
MKSYDRLFIDGEWVKPVRGGTFRTLNPSDESVLADVAAATAEDVDRAVRAARHAFD